MHFPAISNLIEGTAMEHAAEIGFYGHRLAYFGFGDPTAFVTRLAKTAGQLPY
jgi:hypothetical protein